MLLASRRNKAAGGRTEGALEALFSQEVSPTPAPHAQPKHLALTRRAFTSYCPYIHWPSHTMLYMDSTRTVYTIKGACRRDLLHLTPTPTLTPTLTLSLTQARVDEICSTEGLDALAAASRAAADAAAEAAAEAGGGAADAG